jgi:hypothetical protein
MLSFTFAAGSDAMQGEAQVIAAPPFGVNGDGRTLAGPDAAGSDRRTGPLDRLGRLL